MPSDDELLRQLQDEERQREAEKVRADLAFRDRIARMGGTVPPIDPGVCRVCFAPFELSEKGRVVHVCAGPPQQNPVPGVTTRAHAPKVPRAPQPEDVRPGSSHD